MHTQWDGTGSEEGGRGKGRGERGVSKRRM